MPRSICYSGGRPQRHLFSSTVLRIHLLVSIVMTVIILSSASEFPSQHQSKDQFLETVRMKALHKIQRSLESFGQLTANTLMMSLASEPDDADLESDQKNGNEITAPDANAEDSDSSVDIASAVLSPSGKKSPLLLRIRADVKEVDSDASSPPTTAALPGTSPTPQTSNPHHPHRHLRSAGGTGHHGHRRRPTEMTLPADWLNFGTTSPGHHALRHHHQHKRKRKGCPPLHGKDQLLCPSRNVHHYDVCITREQLCDHLSDCPDSEDEDPRLCFFYRSLDDQLKTISHAVLLLVDSVMNDYKQETKTEL